MLLIFFQSLILPKKDCRKVAAVIEVEAIKSVLTN